MAYADSALNSFFLSFPFFFLKHKAPACPGFFSSGGLERLRREEAVMFGSLEYVRGEFVAHKSGRYENNHTELVTHHLLSEHEY